MKFEIKSIDAKWLMECDKELIAAALMEYELIQRKFVPWICQIMANAENEKVRQLLLPNLIEESGSFGRQNSHHDLYLKMLERNKINVQNHTFDQLTLNTEKNFTKIFKSNNTYRSLCVVGPGIEAISADFLYPMYQGVLRNFGNSRSLIYFTLHLSEMEDNHANCIEKAMKIMENENPKLLKKKDKYINEGIEIFKVFWVNLPKRLNLLWNS